MMRIRHLPFGVKSMSEPPTRLDKQEASAGKTGLGVRYVLITSLLLVVVIFAILAVVLSQSG